MLSYRGQALRGLTAEFEMEFTDPEFVRQLGIQYDERRMVLTRPDNRNWREDATEERVFKRGRPITVEMNIAERKHTLRGRVRYRRLHRLVVEGTLDG